MGRLRYWLGLIIAGILLPLSSPAQSTREMQLRVVDAETSQPIPEVKVRAWIRNMLGTDTNGTCAIPLPAPKEGDFAYTLKLVRDGYVAKTITWSKSQKDRIEDMPTNYVTKLEKSGVIGGIVKNEKGEPIPDVKIIFSAPTQDKPDDREHGILMPNFLTEHTDENGRWLCNRVPKQIQKITYRLVHPDYISATFGCVAEQKEVTFIPEKDFFATNAVMVLGHGLELNGVAADSAGKPLTEFTVTQNEEWRHPRAVISTETNGQFKIINLRPGEIFLTVEATGFGPQSVSTLVTNSMPVLKVQMHPGAALKGRIVDEAGQAVTGASIQLESLGFKPLPFHWNATTSADGRFRWESAPADSQAYFISAEGFQPLTETSLVADGQEKTITLRKRTEGMKTLVLGRVLDAVTKQPLSKITVQVKPIGVVSNTVASRAFNNVNGEFSIPVDSDWRGFVVEARAPGHLPAVSGKLSAGDGDQQVEMILTNGVGLEGRVLLPDGQPAAEAEVVLGTEEQGAYLGRRHFENKDYSIYTTTDANGTFVFSREPGAHTIFVAHAQGYAELDLDYAKVPFEIKLAPWGKIEGEVLSGGKPAAGQQMAIGEAFSVPFQAGLTFMPEFFTVKADVQGKYSFADVPPIEVKLGRLNQGRLGSASFVKVNSGTTTKTGAGGNGHEVKGKFSLSGAITVVWTNSDVRLSAKVARPPSPDTKDPEAQKRWAILYWKSPEGKAWQRSRQIFNPTVDGAGEFKIEDVPAGKYQLQVQLREPPEAGGQRLGALSEEVVVAESDATVDLGTLEMEAVKVMKLGTTAPAFEVSTTDGAPLKLVDFRGKYVLLDFWATWCGPCVAEMPHMKATYEAFGKDPRFVMIGLSLDAKVSAPKEFARKNDIKWIQGFLGDWSEATVPSEYGVEGIPAIFLIGPDGAIIARDLRGDGIQSAVHDALEKK